MCGFAVCPVTHLHVCRCERQPELRCDQQVCHLHSFSLPRLAKGNIATFCPTKHGTQAARNILGSREEVLKLRWQRSHHSHTPLVYATVSGLHHCHPYVHCKGNVDFPKEGCAPPTLLMVLTKSVLARVYHNSKVAKKGWVHLHLRPCHPVGSGNTLGSASGTTREDVGEHVVQGGLHIVVRAVHRLGIEQSFGTQHRNNWAELLQLGCKI
mmetsp:Transcript_60797/g.112804  ORF Transcript_60797/g.112804 Transcript_60797/m.112804 type:complete len:211 (+) Transcript_60797:3325-3957(+)